MSKQTENIELINRWCQDFTKESGIRYLQTNIYLCRENGRNGYRVYVNTEGIHAENNHVWYGPAELAKENNLVGRELIQRWNEVRAYLIYQAESRNAAKKAMDHFDVGPAFKKEPVVLKAKVEVPKDVLEQINRYLKEQPENESECFSEDDRITYTAKYEDGTEMDIDCCGVQYEEGGSNTAWTQAVLFNSNGRELCCSEVMDEYAGTWELEYDGKKYIAEVIAEERPEVKELRSGMVFSAKIGFCEECFYRFEGVDLEKTTGDGCIHIVNLNVQKDLYVKPEWFYSKEIRILVDEQKPEEIDTEEPLQVVVREETCPFSGSCKKERCKGWQSEIKFDDQGELKILRLHFSCAEENDVK